MKPARRKIPAKCRVLKAKTLTFPGIFHKFSEGQISHLTHKCEENEEKRQFSLCSDISKACKIVKGEIFEKTSIGVCFLTS